jgi:hypothetical protein
MTRSHEERKVLVAKRSRRTVVALYVLVFSFDFVFNEMMEWMGWVWARWEKLSWNGREGM